MSYFVMNQFRNRGRYRKPNIHMSLEFYFQFRNGCDADKSNVNVLGSPYLVAQVMSSGKLLGIIAKSGLGSDRDCSVINARSELGSDLDCYELK